MKWTNGVKRMADTPFASSPDLLERLESTVIEFEKIRMTLKRGNLELKRLLDVAREQDSPPEIALARLGGNWAETQSIVRNILEEFGKAAQRVAKFLTGQESRASLDSLDARGLDMIQQHLHTLSVAMADALSEAEGLARIYHACAWGDLPPAGSC